MTNLAWSWEEGEGPDGWLTYSPLNTRSRRVPCSGRDPARPSGWSLVVHRGRSCWRRGHLRQRTCTVMVSIWRHQTFMKWMVIFDGQRYGTNSAGEVHRSSVTNKHLSFSARSKVYCVDSMQMIYNSTEQLPLLSVICTPSLAKIKLKSFQFCLKE